MTPGAVLFRGSLRADGLLLDGAPDVELRTALLSGDLRGARLLRWGDVYAVRFAGPRRLRADAVRARLLVLSEGRLLGAPLGDAAQTHPPRSLVFARAGRIVALPLAEAEPVDLAAWIALDGFELLAATGLGAPPGDAADAPVRRPTSVVGRMRDELGPVPTEARALLSGEPGAERPGVLVRLVAWLRDLREGSRARASDTPIRTGPQPPAPPPKTSVFKRVLDQFVLRSRLAKLFGAAHSRYLQRLVGMFERGDLMDALRHAIPLQGERPPYGGGVKWSLFGPRDDLTLRPDRRPGGGSLPLGDGYDFLESLYRRAFDRLVAQGRDEEAAFVLAELLGQTTEAVQFLESRGRLREAAELAEARGADPALVVRQWIVAEDPGRAVRTARRTGCFEAAVALLERGDADEAAGLRLLWGRVLEADGDPLGAVEVWWKVPQIRPAARALAWRVVDDRGPAAPALLPYAATAEGRFDRALARLADIAGDRTSSGTADRVAASRAVLDPRGPLDGAEKAAFARLLLRASFGEEGGLGREPLRALAAAAGPDLRVDVPSLPTPRPTPLWYREAPLRIDVDPRTGRHPVKDVAIVPDGVLAALGEAGVVLFGRSGRVRRRFVEPADRLVVSEHGGRALALARRGVAWRIASLDLGSGRATHRADLRLARWSPTTTAGGLWFATSREALVLLDTLSEGLDALDRVDALGTVLGLSAEGKDLHLLAVRGGDPELLRLDAAPLQLRRRAAIDLALAGAPGLPATVAQLGRSGVVLIGGMDLETGRWHGEIRRGKACTQLELPTPPDAVQCWSTGGVGAQDLWTATHGLDASTVFSMRSVTERGSGHVHFPGSSPLAAARRGDRAAIADSEGRVVVLDLSGRADPLELRT